MILFNTRANCLDLLCVTETVKDDVSAVGCQLQRDGLSDAAGGACDKGGLSGEHGPVSLRRRDALDRVGWWFPDAGGRPASEDKQG